MMTASWILRSIFITALSLCVVSIHVARAQESGTGAHQEHDEGDADGHKGEIHLTDEQLKRLNIRVTRAQAGSARSRISLPAAAAFDPDRVARIGPRLRAKVVRVTKDLGESVAAGDTVVVMDSVALGKARARYLTARARLATEEAAYQREQILAEQNISSKAALQETRARYHEAQAALDAAAEELRLYGLSRQEIKAIEAGSETPLSRYTLKSPIDGVVQKRDITPGQTVTPDETPVHIVDTRRMWVMIDAYERNIPLLRNGQSVSFQVRALPDQRFSGTVDWISRELQAKTRTVTVRAVVDNPGGQLRAGMFGTASIQAGSGGRAALVPVDAVQQLEGRPVVFVPAAEPNAFRPRPVVLGAESGDVVELASGLHPGDEVVTGGAFDLKSIFTAGGRSAAHSH